MVYRGMPLDSSQRSILFIGMVESSHFQTWVKATRSTDIFNKIYVFPSDFPKNGGKILLNTKPERIKNLKLFSLLPNSKLNFYFMHFLELLFQNRWRSILLRALLRILKPDVVHYHEIQHAGYILIPMGDKFSNPKLKKPQIIGSTWGSDLKFFAYSEEHFQKIRRVLDFTDILTMEREEELKELARFSFSGRTMFPVYISVGSQDIGKNSQSKTSLRRAVLVRGYQHDQGRALNALKALELIRDELRGFEIKVFSTGRLTPVRYQVERLSNQVGLNIEVLPKMSHAEFVRYFCNARVYIGLSEVDGLSTSMVEAMTYGAFPIQSENSAAGRFIEDGKSGFVVDPWEIKIISERIRTALQNDRLVDEAAQINFLTISKKYNWQTGIQKITELYS